MEVASGPLPNHPGKLKLSDMEQAIPTAQVKCQYCSAMMNANDVTCPQCHKQRKDITTAKNWFRGQIIFGLLFVALGFYNVMKDVKNRRPEDTPNYILDEPWRKDTMYVFWHILGYIQLAVAILLLFLAYKKYKSVNTKLGKKWF